MKICTANFRPSLTAEQFGRLFVATANRAIEESKHEIQFELVKVPDEENIDGTIFEVQVIS